MTTSPGSIFLLPSPLQENDVSSIPVIVLNAIHRLDYFIVENARTSRRYISATKHPRLISDLIFEEIGDGAPTSAEIERLLLPVMEGRNAGVMSEAGLPAIADPGSLIVRAAHQKKIKVVPYPGPSSIMLALMASGLEGQRFSFHGYLSAKRKELGLQLNELQRRADRDSATQIFIEAPYRNTQVMEEAEKNLSAQRLFCIAANLGSENGFVRTHTIAEWKKLTWPSIHKLPAVFLIR